MFKIKNLLSFLILMCCSNFVLAGPSLCCEIDDRNIAMDLFLKLWPLFLILLVFALILMIMKIIDKKKEKKDIKE